MTSPAPRWLIAGLAVVLLSFVYVVRIHGGMADFAVNYRAGQRLAVGETLYQPEDGHYMFKYLPFAALVYLPLTTLPYEAAKPVWFGISVVALVGIFRLARELVTGTHLYLTLIPALVLAKYFSHELRLGQINLLVTLVMLLAARALVRADNQDTTLNARQSGVDRAQYEIVAGALVGLAVALKPYAALFFPYFIVKGLWRSAAAAAAVLLVALAIGTVFYGPAGNVDVLRQWAFTLSQSTPALLTNSDNVSVLAFFTKWTGEPERAVWLTGAVLGVLAAVMLVVVVRGGGRGGTAVLECAMLLTLIPLVSPLGWDYTFLMSLLALTLLVNSFFEFPRAMRIVLAANFAIIGLALYDLLGRQAYATFMQWSVTTVNFLLVVGSLAYLRFTRVC